MADVLTEEVKAQPVRVFDVVLLGPFLILAGTRRGPLPESWRIGLILAGIGTLVFNAVNFLIIEEKRRG